MSYWLDTAEGEKLLEKAFEAAGLPEVDKSELEQALTPTAKLRKNLKILRNFWQY